MPSVLNGNLVRGWDNLIQRNQLHEGDWREPVNPFPLLQNIRYWYGLQSRSVLAIHYRWRERNKWLSEIALNELLREPEWSAENRHSLGHEYSHIYLKHPGDQFILWRDGYGPDRFGQFLENCYERQAEYMTSFLLVKRSALLAMPGEAGDYIAGVADVPPHLIPLRWYIWDRYKR